MAQPVIVNNPPANNPNNNLSVIVGAVVILLVVILIIFYGLPYLRGIFSPQVSIPDHVNVNIQNPSK